VYEPKLGLPEKSNYSDKHIVAAYRKLLKQVGTTMNIEHLEGVADTEKRIEPYIAGEAANKEYNPYTFAELQHTYSHIDWPAIMKGWGCAADTYNNTKFIVGNSKYTHLLNRMCSELDKNSWRAWLRSMLFITFLEYLPPPFDDLQHELYGKLLRGSADKLPQKWITLKVLETYAKQDLSRIYVEQLVSKTTKPHTISIVKTLKHATIMRLHKASWMAAETRATAIQKVNDMLFEVAYPERWTSETHGLTIDPTRPLKNVFLLAEKDTKKMIGDLNSKCGRLNSRWDDGSFVVNAYCYSEGNRMTIPAGILQPPFFDETRSHGWNYGGIGAAIAHEITHGFDDEGRKYDAQGNTNNWWTVKDEHEFAKKTKAIIKLFDKVEYMGGKVDGESTLSENIADLGGLAISLTALGLEMKDAEPAVWKKEFRDFFTSYAVSWRNKDRPQKAKQALTLDVHAPAPLRVNLIVRNFQEFYDAFDVKEGDEGWIPVEDRVLLW
jgi:putative endopeptidase